MARARQHAARRDRRPARRGRRADLVAAALNDVDEIELLHEEGRLFLDAGEFRTRLLHDAEADVPTFVTGDTPLLGVQVRLREGQDGAPTVVLGQEATTYTFEPVR